MNENEKQGEVVISTEGLNYYGYRVLTSGVDLKQYKRNPILLYDHNRSLKPIGVVENIRVDGNRILGTPKFDRIGQLSNEIADKWEAGTLKMVSPGLDPVQCSDDPKHLLPGQTRPTLIKSKLVEVSITDIGANDDAIRLYKDGKLLELGTGAENVLLPLLLSNTEQKKDNQKEETMKTLLSKLGLPETATEVEALQALEAVHAENANLKKEKEDVQLRNIGELVDLHISQGRVTADKKEHFVNLGKVAGYESLSITLNAIPAPLKPNDVIAQATPGASANLSKKWEEMSETQLLELRKSDWNTYSKLFADNFGFAPEKDE